ncbi:MAG: sulfite exporter TauE/SafE family protein [Bacteroidota bacterium]
MTILEALLLIAVGLITGFINILAGGGSLLTLPTLIFLGLPPNVANGTNRIAILFQSVVSSAGFRSKGVKTLPHSLYFGISAMIGAIIGAQIAIDIKGETFNKILAIIMVFVVAYLVIHRKTRYEDFIERVTGKYLWLGIIAFFFIGIYGGFIQAGTGFLMLLALSGINQFSLVKSNAIKVFVALIYTISAVAIFILNDKVNWQYGLTLALGNATGGWIASRWSVKKGDGVVKIFLVIMVIIMAIKLWFFD